MLKSLSLFIPMAINIPISRTRSNTDIISPRLNKANAYNCIEHSIPVKPGRLVIFPAWLAHQVTKNRSGQTRVSLSFNASLLAKDPSQRVSASHAEL